MIWQDWVISIGQIVLAIALIPTIRSKDKPPLSTGITTAIAIGTISLTFLTLGLWFSAATAGLASSGWFFISYQKYRQRK